MIGSGANHAIYAIFMKLSKEANGGKKVGLIRGSGGRMGSYFYVMFRDVRMELVLKQLVAHPEIKKIKQKRRTLLAFRDIKDDTFWRGTYAVCCLSYACARLLRLCDKTDPIMGELEHGKRRTTEALENSEELLLDDALFPRDSENDGELAFEEQQIFGENSVVDEEEDDVDRSMNLHTKITWLWSQATAKLGHDYAKAGFALSVNPTVWEYSQVEDRIDGEIRHGLERLVKKLHVTPNPNNKVRGKSVEEIVDLFWTEFEDFRNQRGEFSNLARFRSKEARAGKSHLWHEKYSLPYTKVLGYIACRVTSKNGGIGPCERGWGDVKYIADGKRFNLGESLENRSIIYTTARLREARIKNEFGKANDGEVGFGDDDLDFDADLGKFGVSVDHLKSPCEDKRRFEAWMTEEDLVRWKHNDAVSEEYLLQKFKGLRFYIPDNEADYKVCDKNLEWKSRDGWVVIAEKEGGNDSDDEPLALALVCELVADNAAMNEGIEIVKNPES